MYGMYCVYMYIYIYIYIHTHVDMEKPWIPTRRFTQNRWNFRISCDYRCLWETTHFGCLAHGKSSESFIAPLVCPKTIDVRLVPLPSLASSSSHPLPNSNKWVLHLLEGPLVGSSLLGRCSRPMNHGDFIWFRGIWMDMDGYGIAFFMLHLRRP